MMNASDQSRLVQAHIDDLHRARRDFSPYRADSTVGPVARSNPTGLSAATVRAISASSRLAARRTRTPQRSDRRRQR
jgi:hypothetical protein